MVYFIFKNLKYVPSGPFHIARKLDENVLNKIPALPTSNVSYITPFCSTLDEIKLRILVIPHPQVLIPTILNLFDFAGGNQINWKWWGWKLVA